jgi:hypothetical protein
MSGDTKRRMTLWCLLAGAAVLLVFLIGLMLFFEPGHGAGPLDKRHAAPINTHPAPHH